METKYPAWAIANFVILSVFGLILRYMQVFSLPWANYQFLLHAHSHFAFAGWMFFSIALLLIHSLFGNSPPAAYKTVLVATQICAGGMLLSFSFYGYNPVSISFSTLFITVTYLFTYLVYRKPDLKAKWNGTSRLLILGSLIFVCLSSAGPFALAPIAAAGLKNSALYQDAIYFYLHFQMNGFMLLASLGLFASAYLGGMDHAAMRPWLYTFIISAVPLFLIFTLWAEPPAWVWATAFLSSALNLASWLRLCVYCRRVIKTCPFLVKAALAAISIKIALQLILCIPMVGRWVFHDRNLIIGYVHLLTLGCIMPLILDQFIRRGFFAGSIRIAALNRFFILNVVLYLSALFFQPVLALFHIVIPHYRLLLFLLSVLFILTGVFYYVELRRKRDNLIVPKPQLPKYDEAYSDM